MIKEINWLSENLGHEKLIILDASLVAKKARNHQIKGARFFDLPGKFSDRNSMYPNTMPSAEQFQTEARSLGISNNSIVVIYDNVGVYSAPRVWYMFRSMGHQEVYVLNGGLPAWEQAGLPTESVTDTNHKLGSFIATYDKNAVKSTEDIEANIKSGSHIVLDARSAARFNGTAPEPRVELQSGSIPGSASLPFTEVLADGKFRSKNELLQIFSSSKPMVFTCGSGLTACITLLAAEIVDQETEKSVYDGSWTEWALQHNLLT